jgi:hypothetical protein
MVNISMVEYCCIVNISIWKTVYGEHIHGRILMYLEHIHGGILVYREHIDGGVLCMVNISIWNTMYD